MAAAFDLILSEYAGYTDASILELPVCRIRQMVDMIVARKRREMEREDIFRLSVAQVHAQALGSLLAGVAMTKEGSRNISRAAARIDFLSAYTKKEKEPPSTAAVFEAFGISQDGTMGARGG